MRWSGGPTGFAWLRELSPLPVIALNDDALISVVAKLAGVLKLSIEMTADTSRSAAVFAAGCRA
jgi:hypothetical protein